MEKQNIAPMWLRKLSTREGAFIISALRNIQATTDEETRGYLCDYDETPLNDREIDELCMTINLSDVYVNEEEE